MRLMREYRTRGGILALVIGGVAISLGAITATSNVGSAPPQVHPPPQRVVEQNLDASGLIRVHEQGTVAVTGTVNVANAPATQDVRVTNLSLPVAGSVAVTNFPASQPVTGSVAVTNFPAAAAGGTTRFFDHEFFPFDSDEDFEVDIHGYSRIRIAVTVNGSGTVEFFYSTDGGISGSFDVDSGHQHTVLLGEVAGTRLFISMNDPDGEQVFFRVFGS